MQMGGADQYTKAMEARNRSEGWWIYQVQKISHLQQKEKKKKWGNSLRALTVGGGGGGEAVRHFYNNHLYNQIENYILLLES